MCEGDLKVFVNFRNDLIDKQKALYDLAGLLENHYTSMKTEHFDAHEEFFDGQSLLNETEGIELEEVIDDEANRYETMDFEETYEDSNQEILQDGYQEESNISMKIEKLERDSVEFVYPDDNDDDETEFGFMEEFIDEEDISEIADAANFTDL